MRILAILVCVGLTFAATVADACVGGPVKSDRLTVANFPNPFNAGTTVSYNIPTRGTVSVVIYSMHGARVARLVDRQERATGSYTVQWNGRSDNGSPVSSGMYFARIEHNGATRVSKMMLLK